MLLLWLKLEDIFGVLQIILFKVRYTMPFFHSSRYHGLLSFVEAFEFIQVTLKRFLPIKSVLSDALTDLIF